MRFPVSPVEQLKRHYIESLCQVREAAVNVDRTAHSVNHVCSGPQLGVRLGVFNRVPLPIVDTNQVIKLIYW